MKIIILTLATMLASLSGCAGKLSHRANAHGDGYAYTHDYLRWMINEKMSERDIVGLSIALLDDDRIVWAQGFGHADKTANIEATPETVYRVGSITKLFAATAVMQLAEQGRVDIDQTLTRYVPEFSMRSRFRDAGAPTLRELMAYRSGLPSDRMHGRWGDETADYRALPVLLRDEYLAYPRNTVNAYSNLGYSLLGLVVENVGAMAYADYVEERILRPTGMRRSCVAPNLRDDGVSAAGHHRQQAHATPYLRDVPAGALNSNVLDLTRFAQVAGSLYLTSNCQRRLRSPPPSVAAPQEIRNCLCAPQILQQSASGSTDLSQVR